MTGLLIRILLRYIAGALIAHGWLSADSADFASDPDIAEFVEIALGGVVGAVAEGWYYLARRFGWDR